MSNKSTTILSSEEIQAWRQRIAALEHPRELVVDLLFALQKRNGYLSDAAMEEGAELLGMTALELEELTTFYPFLYRRSVGRYVIHVCDSLICYMNGYEKIADYLCRTLNVAIGGTSADGLFTVLPICCIGLCDYSPAMLINKEAYGNLTPERIDEIIRQLREA